MNATTPEQARLLTPAQAAERIGLSVSTLSKRRCLTNDGPVFVRIGAKILYPADLLDEWLSRLPRRTSTSDTAEPQAAACPPKTENATTTERPPR